MGNYGYCDESDEMTFDYWGIATPTIDAYRYCGSYISSWASTVATDWYNEPAINPRFLYTVQMTNYGKSYTADGLSQMGSLSDPDTPIMLDNEFSYFGMQDGEFPSLRYIMERTGWTGTYGTGGALILPSGRTHPSFHMYNPVFPQDGDYEQYPAFLTSKSWYDIIHSYYGCTDPNAINFTEFCNDDYSPLSNYNSYLIECVQSVVDDGSCYYSGDNNVFGCTDDEACNYNSEATVDDDSCWYSEDGCSCDDGEGAIVDECGVCNGSGANTQCCIIDGQMQYACGESDCPPDSDNDGICDEGEIEGCTDEGAINYNSSATEDDDSCYYSEIANVTYDYITRRATLDYNNINNQSPNNIGLSICDSNNCYHFMNLQDGDIYVGSDNNEPSWPNQPVTYVFSVPVYGDASPGGEPGHKFDGEYHFNIWVDVPQNDLYWFYSEDFGIYPPPIYGCTDEESCGYNPSADIDDGSCWDHFQCWDESFVCFMQHCPPDPLECDEIAHLECPPGQIWGLYQGICQCYSPLTVQVPGCTDPEAGNYNPNATVDDGSCVYPPEESLPGDGCNCNTGQASNEETDCIFECNMNCVDETNANNWSFDSYCDDGSYYDPVTGNTICLLCSFFNWDSGACGGGEPSCINDDNRTSPPRLKPKLPQVKRKSYKRL